MAKRFVIIGGGPAGNQAATHAARLGAEVTLIERDIVGGAAHLWDCIPSKAMIATGGALSQINAAEGMGLTDVSASLDFDALRARIGAIEERAAVVGRRACSRARACTMLQGTGRLKGPHEVVVETADGPDRARRRRRSLLSHRQPAPHPRLGADRRRRGCSPPATPTRRPSCPSTWS